MNSRAISLNEQDPRLPADVEAAQRKSCDKGVREQAGAADGTATSGLLPVPKPVEPIAPSIPEVEPGNKQSLSTSRFGVYIWATTNQTNTN